MLPPATALRKHIRTSIQPLQNRFPQLHLPHWQAKLVRKRILHLFPASSIFRHQRKLQREDLSSGDVVELRFQGSLLGYALFDSLSSSSSSSSSSLGTQEEEEGQEDEEKNSKTQNQIDESLRSLFVHNQHQQQQYEDRFINFDFLDSVTELKTHKIGDSFWKRRVQIALERKRKSCSSSSSSSSAVCRRLIHGSADGFPHIFIDEMNIFDSTSSASSSPRSFFSVRVGNSHAVTKTVLPPVIQALLQEAQEKKEVDIFFLAGNNQSSGSKINNLNEQREQEEDEEGEEKPIVRMFPSAASPSSRKSVSSIFRFAREFDSYDIPLPFDLRMKPIRRFLADICVGKSSFVIFLNCDLPTLMCVASNSESQDAQLLFCHGSSNRLQIAERMLASSSSSSCFANQENVIQQQADEGVNNITRQQQKRRKRSLLPIDVQDEEGKDLFQKALVGTELLSTDNSKKKFTVVLQLSSSSSSSSSEKDARRIKNVLSVLSENIKKKKNSSSSSSSSSCLLVLIEHSDSSKIDFDEPEQEQQQGEGKDNRTNNSSNIDEVLANVSPASSPNSSSSSSSSSFCLRILKVFDGISSEFPVSNSTSFSSSSSSTTTGAVCHVTFF